MRFVRLVRYLGTYKNAVCDDGIKVAELSTIQPNNQAKNQANGEDGLNDLLHTTLRESEKIVDANEAS